MIERTTSLHKNRFLGCIVYHDVLLPHLENFLAGDTDIERAPALQLIQRHQNVVLEWFVNYRMTLSYEDRIHSLGPGRFTFRIDPALHSPAWELGRYLSRDLPDDMQARALGRNIRTILAERCRIQIV